VLDTALAGGNDTKIEGLPSSLLVLIMHEPFWTPDWRGEQVSDDSQLDPVFCPTTRRRDRGRRGWQASLSTRSGQSRTGGYASTGLADPPSASTDPPQATALLSQAEADPPHKPVCSCTQHSTALTETMTTVAKPPHEVSL